MEDITSFSLCYHLDIDMNTVTKDNIKDIKTAWALIDNAESVDGGILLTCFTKVPTIDIPLIMDVYMNAMNTPNANGVIF